MTFTKRKQTHRRREQSCGYQAGGMGQEWIESSVTCPETLRRAGLPGEQSQDILFCYGCDHWVHMGFWGISGWKGSTALPYWQPLIPIPQMSQSSDYVFYEMMLNYVPPHNSNLTLPSSTQTQPAFQSNLKKKRKKKAELLSVHLKAGMQSLS